MRLNNNILQRLKKIDHYSHCTSFFTMFQSEMFQLFLNCVLLLMALFINTKNEFIIL